MKLYPEKYENLELKIIEKRLINLFNSRLNEDWFLFLKVTPIKACCVNFIFINKNYGVLCLSIDEYNESKKINSYIKIVQPFWQKCEQLLFNKLNSHRLLRKSEFGLKFNYNWLYAFPNISKDKNQISNEVKKNAQIIFKEDLSIHKIVDVITVKASQSIIQDNLRDVFFKEDIVNTITQHIAPEYTIPRPQQALNSIKIKKEDIDINEHQQSVKQLRLDNDQINIINNLGFGHQLMLACAGSGKSALLIAKAFRVAGKYPDEKVLVTCFNRNLADYYLWRIHLAGFREKNVQCFSFFALIKSLLDKNGLRYHNYSNINNKFDHWFEIAQNALAEGKLKGEYVAIFIDEIQIFKKEWYKFCFNLLKDKKDGILVISGDKSQNINNNIKKGQAPWQVQEEDYPEFNNQNTIRIEKNYRNNKPINTFINSFVSISKEYFSRLQMPEAKDSDLFLRGKSMREGPEPTIIQSNRMEEKNEIVKKIKFLSENENIPLSEIAVMFYHKQYKPRKYYPLTWLKKELEQEYINYSILSSGQDIPDTYRDREGVTLLTIESALGLDFEAVILCGLFPMGFHKNINRINTIEKLQSQGERSLEEKEEFFKCINQIYTGCTRARDYLFIILTEPLQKNLFSKIIMDSWRKANGRNDSL